MNETKKITEQYEAELLGLGFPIIQIENRSEIELLHMRDWSNHFSRQNLGNWSYQSMGAEYIIDNFFTLSKVERR